MNEEQITDRKVELERIYAEQHLADLGEVIQGTCFTHGVHSGTLDALKEIGELIRKKAGECFATGNDQKAMLYRELAESVVDRKIDEIKKDRNKLEIIQNNKLREETAFKFLDMRNAELIHLRQLAEKVKEAENNRPDDETNETAVTA